MRKLKVGIVIVIVVVIVVWFSRISSKSKPGNNYIVNMNTPFEDLNISSMYEMRWLGCDISVDLTTGVLYYNNLVCERMTVLVNEDGTPKNIKDYMNEEQLRKYEEYVKEECDGSRK